MELVGISGKKRSGKNTAAKVLVYKYKFKEFSFAAPLKELVSKVFDLSQDQVNDEDLKDLEFTVPVEIKEENVYEIVRLCSGMCDFRFFKKREETAIKHMLNRVTKQLNTPPPVQGQVQMPYFQREYKKFKTPRELLQFVGTDLVRDCISPYFWCRVLDSIIKNEDKVVITDMRFFEEREFIRHKKGVLVQVLREGIENKDAHKSENSLGTYGDYDFLIKNTGTVMDLQDSLDAIYRYHKFLREDKIYKVKET